MASIVSTVTFHRDSSHLRVATGEGGESPWHSWLKRWDMQIRGWCRSTTRTWRRTSRSTRTLTAFTDLLVDEILF